MRAVYATCVAVDTVVLGVAAVSMDAATMIVGSLALLAAVIASASVPVVREDGAR